MLDFKEKECPTLPNTWDTMKAAVRGKFIALKKYIKNLVSSHTNYLTVYLKALEQ